MFASPHLLNMARSVPMWRKWHVGVFCDDAFGGASYQVSCGIAPSDFLFSAGTKTLRKASIWLLAHMRGDLISSELCVISSELCVVLTAHEFVRRAPGLPKSEAQPWLETTESRNSSSCIRDTIRDCNIT